MNKWTLTEEVEGKYKPIIQRFIDKVEKSDYIDDEDFLNLSDTELNPYTLWELLKNLGYEKEEIDSNGWQLDFSIEFKKEGFKNIVIEGTGITFELNLGFRG